MGSNGLCVGVGRVDITPAPGTQLAGNIGHYRPMNEVRDHIFATAAVFDDGATRLCLVAANLLASTNVWSDRLRSRIADRLQIPAEQVMFHVHQNHATPSLGHLFTFENESSPLMDRWPWLLGGDDAYHSWCVERIDAAVAAAEKDLSPVRLEAGRGIDGRVAHNRRFVLRDGTAVCHAPGERDQILHREGPEDPEVGVWRFTGTDGAGKALLLHHTCHPCDGFPHRYVIADWTGQWETDMVAACPAMGAAMTLNGCCGNVYQLDHLAPTPDPGYQAIAAMLTETALHALQNTMHEQTGVPLISRRRILEIPWRRLTAAEIAEARAKIDAFPEPEWVDDARTRASWDWVYAVGRLDLARMQQTYPHTPYEVQVFRIGDAAIVGLQGEPFVEAQLDIKRRSPAPYTTVAHFCNGYAGYLPTRRAFAGGGYETRTGAGSKHCEAALEMVTDAAVELLDEVFGR